MRSPRCVAVDVRRRVLDLRRHRREMKADPLHFDSCIVHQGQTLGCHYSYTLDSERQTLEWLDGSVYAQEARKCDPIDSCHKAIAQFHALLLNHDQQAGDDFLATAHGLLDSGENLILKGHNCFVIPHFFQVEGYQLHHKPWANAMVQGWAASLFLRAYQLGGDERFLDAARHTCGVFQVPVDNGGLASRLPHGMPFYEKYPFPGQIRHVLNGFMASLFGLHDLVRVADDNVARVLFETGLETLSDSRTLDAFDNGYSTLYDLGGTRRATPACLFYTWIHARQLAGLACITGSEKLMKRAKRWREFVFRKRYALRSRADCLLFRARRLPSYLLRYVSADAEAS